ncbi:hypothetical protein Q0601_00830 [Paracoccus onubensis]|uniref:hypothetical protein n=1 Tax=Paracoccus onubensis TaxID=1675788 RepID=UPI002731FCC2|nr:hypothetical protein [Paracoccus onubensis]MDP0925706.1 hypothetical protein [Paracoccus onubensis]
MIDMDDPKQRRDFLIHYARVNLKEAGRRREDRASSCVLIGWAAKARREAASIDVTPAQGDLFAE